DWSSDVCSSDLEQLQTGDFAHLLEHFVGGSKELGVVGGFGRGTRCRCGAILRAGSCRDGTPAKANSQRKQCAMRSFGERSHILSRIAESRFSCRRPERPASSMSSLTRQLSKSGSRSA